MELFMDLISDFISEYGVSILYALLTAVAGFIGTAIKKIYKKYVNDKAKESVVKTCVKAVEQMYKNLHGEDKYNKVVEFVVEMLNEKGITVSSIELQMLIESAVAEFNEAFKKTDSTETQEVVEE